LACFAFAREGMKVSQARRLKELEKENTPDEPIDSRNYNSWSKFF
jgi:hypothetical protein